MKYSIRKGVFETNSSSTHVLCTIRKIDYDKWKNKELYFLPEMFDKISDNNILQEKFINHEEAIKIRNEFIEKHNLKDHKNNLINYLVKNNYQILGRYPLTYEEYRLLNELIYPEEIQETESGKLYFGDTKDYIKFHRWTYDQFR